MFGTKKKQRSDLPEKQQLTKYYEMDGALRAYANRMALLGMTCGGSPWALWPSLPMSGCSHRS